MFLVPWGVSAFEHRLWIADLWSCSTYLLISYLDRREEKIAAVVVVLWTVGITSTTRRLPGGSSGRPTVFRRSDRGSRAVAPTWASVCRRAGNRGTDGGCLWTVAAVLPPASPVGPHVCPQPLLATCLSSTVPPSCPHEISAIVDDANHERRLCSVVCGSYPQAYPQCGQSRALAIARAVRN